MKIEYPCLMQNKETNEVVLFTSEQTGRIVVPTDKANRALGYLSRVWVMNWFEPFEGELSIRMDK